MIKRKKTRNKFEKKLHAQLKKAKAKFSYESEKIPYVISGHYIPDFVVKTPKGTLYIEAKGYLRPEHKRKMVAVRKQHPAHDIKIVFYAFKRKDIAWAERNGFPWAVANIPEDWLI